MPSPQTDDSIGRWTNGLSPGPGNLEAEVFSAAAICEALAHPSGKGSRVLRAATSDPGLSPSGGGGRAKGSWLGALADIDSEEEEAPQSAADGQMSSCSNSPEQINSTVPEAEALELKELVLSPNETRPRKSPYFTKDPNATTPDRNVDALSDVAPLDGPSVAQTVPARNSRRVLRAVLSDPGPDHAGPEDLPPWLHAIAEADGEDAASQNASALGLPSHEDTPAVDLLTVSDAVSAEASLGYSAIIGKQGSREQLISYCRLLEQRTEQLRTALRCSESARARVAASTPPVPSQLPPPRQTCCVCMDAPRECAFTPCGHLCVCRICGTTAVRLDRRCPICRATIGRVLRIVDP